VSGHDWSVVSSPLSLTMTLFVSQHHVVLVWLSLPLRAPPLSGDWRERERERVMAWA